ncbi:methyltransferase domain-containing protein [uncultured Methanobrevibacter sp.]|uniref:class I SAM-dependent methyltransferase n=1 Tax=uncultured Methanobrevibacter sp. TaxID=253161 RepID=UPI0034376929
MEIPLYFYEAFRNMDRLAPGSDESTLKAINYIDFNRDSELNILDIGCGVGSQTLLLAKYFKNSTIEAIDLFNHYLKCLDEKINKYDLGNRVYTCQMDMNDLDYPNCEFEIVFSEASAYIMGFKKALKEWKRVLKDDGYLIISELSWIQKPSFESKNFWKTHYSEIDSIDNKINQIKEEGYIFVDYFILPKKDFESYYHNLKSNLKDLDNNSFKKDFKKEIDLYENNSDDYSYVFYIMKKSAYQ